MTESCDDRITAQLASRESAMHELYAMADNDNDAAREELDSYALEASVVTTLRVLISTGGPSDYLTADIEKTGYEYARISDITYHFADWFDHAEITVDENSSLARYFDEIVECQ